MPIINTLMDTDFYKYTMAQFVLHKHPDAIVKYAFKCRNGTGTPFGNKFEAASEFAQKINEEIDHLCTLRHTRDEIEWLRNIPFFKPDYIEYLRLLQLNRDYIQCWAEVDGTLNIEVEGPWVSTIWFEVPVLAIVSELHSLEDSEFEINKRLEGRKRLNKKVKLINDFCRAGEFHAVGDRFKFADFGTRRRNSYEWQQTVLEWMLGEIPEGVLVGTSNVHFAKRLGIRPVGTMAHELLQAFQQLGGRLVDSQKACLDEWAHEYRGQLGIALTDVVGFDRFLKDFDLFFAKLFDGCRHDSGDPIKWGHKLINHYRELGIDAKTKTAVFSDGLDIPRAIDLFRKFNNMINVSFGIGTNLTNDMGYEVPQLVMKMIECNGRPVAKVPDSEGKGMCRDDRYLAHLKYVYRIEE